MNHPSRLSLALAALVAVLVVATPAVASAAVAEYQVQYSPVGTTGNSQMIVNVILSDDTPLPAVVEVPIPAGAQVLWAGEIFGGDPALDPARETSVTPVAGGQLVTFTLSEVRIAQVEADLARATIDGSGVSATMSWTNTGESAPVLASIRLPANVGDVTIQPQPIGQPQFNDVGESLYTLPVRQIANGDVYEATVSYRTGIAAEAGGSSVLLVVVGVLLVLAIVTLVVLVRRDRSRRVGSGLDG
ncbi:MAG: hypothetical protein QMC79_00560 [Anaerosomatales bacterium]|nr:hypothetical protein [Anaerosomatales bacterium]